MINFDLDKIINFLEADSTLTGLLGSVTYDN